jgi:hypothetical protein
MRTFKAICATLILALSLSATTVFADGTPGDGHTPGSAAPQTGTSTAPEDPALTTETETTSADSEVITLQDILWALTAIY